MFLHFPASSLDTMNPKEFQKHKSTKKNPFNLHYIVFQGYKIQSKNINQDWFLQKTYLKDDSEEMNAILKETRVQDENKTKKIL